MERMHWQFNIQYLIFNADAEWLMINDRSQLGLPLCQTTKMGHSVIRREDKSYSNKTFLKRLTTWTADSGHLGSGPVRTSDSLLKLSAAWERLGTRIKEGLATLFSFLISLYRHSTVTILSSVHPVKLKFYDLQLQFASILHPTELVYEYSETNWTWEALYIIKLLTVSSCAYQ